MANKITVIFDDNTIYVDGVAIECEFSSHKAGLKVVQWRGTSGQLEIEDPEFRVSPAVYSVDVKPYYDIWLAENAKIDAEIQAQEEYENSLEGTKERRLGELKSAFEQASVDAHCVSSLGFEINAGSVAKRDIDGLIEKMEYSGQETEMFRAYDNTFHQVTLDQLKLMRINVIDNGNALYQRKWQLEAQINACTTVEELNAIDIDFEV